MRKRALGEECGVFGLLGSPDAAEETTLGLHALQHRGQEGCGIVSYDGAQFHLVRGKGLVADVLSSKETLARLEGAAAIGHNLYSTSGSATTANLQPMFAELDIGGIALAHNGNLTNAKTIRKRLVNEGSLFQSQSDSEVLIHLLARAQGSLPKRLLATLAEVDGGYAVLLLTQDALIGMRDPLGFRPLLLGQTRAKAFMLASESCAFDIIDGHVIREIEPGEIVRIDAQGCSSVRFAPRKPRRSCLFEYIYFSRPDSLALSNRDSAKPPESIYQVRKRIGRELAREQTANRATSIDVVVPIPDSGVAAALGFAEEMRLPMDFGIIRNHYVGRTFIEPQPNIRHFGVRLKHNADPALLKGKSVALIDDSIVRGTTSRKIIALVRQAGAKDVHLFIASPPIKSPCYYGVDTPNQKELLAAQHSCEDMARILDSDSLTFLSPEGLFRALEDSEHGQNTRWCEACLTGCYPTPLIDKEMGKQPHAQLSLLSEP